MSLSVMVTCVLVMACAIATLVGDIRPELRDFMRNRQPSRQSGDSSLSPRSVNWLAATALAGALLICFLLA